MAILSFDNKIESATLTVTTGSVSNLDEVKRMQTPLPFATFTPSGGVIEIRAVIPTTTIRVLGVIGHDIPDSATLLFRDSSNTLLATGTVTGANSFVALSQPLGEVRFRIEGLSTAPVRIAALWAAEGFEALAEETGEHGGVDYGYRSKVGAVTWTNTRTVARVVPATLRGLTDDQAWGELDSVFKFVGTTRPIVYMPRTTDQTQIDRRTVYGTMSARGRIIPEKPYYRAEFDIEEMA